MTLEAAPARNWRALTLSLFLIFSALILYGLAALLVIFTISLPKAASTEQLTFSLLAGGTFFIATVLLPAIYINVSLFFRLPELNLRFPPMRESIVLITLITLWGLTLLLGQVSASTSLAVIALPFLNVLAVVLPIIFFLRLAFRKLTFPSAQQAWSVFAVTLVIAPLLGTLLEGLALVIFMGIGAFFISSDAILTRQISLLWDILQQNGNITGHLSVVAPMLFTPIGMLFVFGLFSVAVPLIEESVKVLALWVFADQIKHPVQGFILGALCGAAFALAENVGFSSAGGSEWTASVMQRATAILPHTLNSGILGWALVSVWKAGTWFRLGGAYLAVILIHGLWNGISIALAFSNLTAYAAPPFLSIFGNPTGFAVGEIVMMLGTFGGLIYANQALQHTQPAQAEYNERPS